LESWHAMEGCLCYFLPLESFSWSFVDGVNENSLLGLLAAAYLKCIEQERGICASFKHFIMVYRLEGWEPQTDEFAWKEAYMRNMIMYIREHLEKSND
jgi:hypothetical protein